MTVSNLNASSSVTLDSLGAGSCKVGPQDAAGPSTWHITTVIVQTTRPGLAPVPTVQLYTDSVSPANSQGLDYDGSFNEAGGDLTITRGSYLIAVWNGGQAGDVATLTVSGTKE